MMEAAPAIAMDEVSAILVNLKRIKLRAQYLLDHPACLSADEISDICEWAQAIKEILR